VTFRIRALGQDSVSLVAVASVVLFIWLLSAPMVASLEVVANHEILVSIWTSQSIYRVGENIVIEWQLDCSSCDGETSLNDVLARLDLQGSSHFSLDLGFITRHGSIELGGAPPNSVGNWVVTLEVQFSKLFGPDGTFYGSNQFQIRGDGSEYVGVPETSWPQVLQPSSKGNSSVSISATPESLTVGENTTVRGTISPATQTSVTLRYTRPDGLTFTVNLESGSSGSFAYVFRPDERGSWAFSVAWYGDANYTGSESKWVTIAVVEPQVSPLAQFFTQVGGVEMGILDTVAAILLVILLFAILFAFVAARQDKAPWRSGREHPRTMHGLQAVSFS
jgi:hypothetical protein